MRIITGKHKNRVIPTLKKSNYRPSTTKFREALFSILSSGEFEDSRPIIGARILDLFSGTGSLSFEALSRGAESVLLVDNTVINLKMAEDFAQKIGEQNKVKTLLMDATALSRSIDKYNLVFMDPPYYNNYVIKSLNCLLKYQWLDAGAIIAIELEVRQKLELPTELRLIKEKIYGNNKLLILKYEQA